MKIGEYIAKMREEGNISRQQLADVTGVSRQQISNIENGLNTSVETLEKLLGVFGYELSIKDKEN